MSEKMNVEDATKALNSAKIAEKKHYEDMASKNRDLSMGVGVDPNAVEKKLPESNSIPDVVLLPRKKRKMSHNKPW